MSASSRFNRTSERDIDVIDYSVWGVNIRNGPFVMNPRNVATCTSPMLYRFHLQSPLISPSNRQHSACDVRSLI
jgi:hypothetical protein